MAEERNPDLAGDLLRIHRVVTRGLKVSLENGKAYLEAGFPNAPDREGFYNYVKALATVLHSHHSGEDTIAFPLVRVKIPAAPVDYLCADHEKMKVHLEEIERLMANNEPPLSLLVEQLEKLNQIWGEHIHLEETVFSVQNMRSIFQPYEQADLTRQFSQHSMQTVGDRDSLVIPFLLYNLTPEDRAIFSQTLPPIVTQQLVPTAWKARWSTMKPFLLN
jgi:hemerythrin-like domain-containing protein